jgi:hypothetical protein
MLLVARSTVSQDAALITPPQLSTIIIARVKIVSARVLVFATALLLQTLPTDPTPLPDIYWLSAARQAVYQDAALIMTQDLPPPIFIAGLPVVSACLLVNCLVVVQFTEKTLQIVTTPYIYQMLLEKLILSSITWLGRQLLLWARL